MPLKRTSLTLSTLLTFVGIIAIATPACNRKSQKAIKKNLLETPEAKSQRMAWWREARFGMFIHWGLYAIPAGEWKGETRYGEWIRHTAQIPLDTYDLFLPQFNPVLFDAENWVKMAKEAGMKYIIITSKHHDGFCLFDSKETDFDMMATPFRRDILKELAQACETQGIRLGFYYSIMDWHHPDYLPRRNWETNRDVKGADYQRYIRYMKTQLRELCNQYDQTPHVLWFDGEWEPTWTHPMGLDMYHYVRSLKPDIIINNRVDTGRDGMAGLSGEGFAGDFGTPEQEVPATGLPDIDWESCITMNDNWGYNKADQNYKSVRELIHLLTDIASKGGNLLLNIGPKPDGTFPPESIVRLKAIGQWMHYNKESIYGTQASPFGAFDWGRCTWKTQGGNTYYYLHVFQAPADGRLVLHGLGNEPIGAQFLAYPRERNLPVVRQEDALIVEIAGPLPDSLNTVVVLAVKGQPLVYLPPVPLTNQLFIGNATLQFKTPDDPKIHIRYTLDGTSPTLLSDVYKGPFLIDATTTIRARYYKNEQPVSAVSETIFQKLTPQKGQVLRKPKPGLIYRYYEGNWDRLPDFSTLKVVKSGITSNFDRSAKNTSGEHYGFDYEGYIKIPREAIYTFYLTSDDGSDLWINNQQIVSNDGLHGMKEAKGMVALSPGWHSIRVRYFEKTGSDDLIVRWESDFFGKSEIPVSVFFRE